MFRKSPVARKKQIEQTVVTPSVVDQNLTPTTKPQRVVSRRLEDQCSAGQVVWVAGPAYVYSVDQVLSSAGELASVGVKFIRSRAYWPQAQPRDFIRHLESGLKVLYAAAKYYSMQVVSEIIDSKYIEVMSRYCDVLEVRPENAMDVRLLRDLSFTNKTVIYNRHPMMSLERYLTMVRILELGKCCKVVLAESGKKVMNSGFQEQECSLSSLLYLRRKTSHPILFDATSCIESGRELMLFSATAVSAGADGIIAEVASKYQSLSGSSLGVGSQLAVWQLQRAIKNTTALKYTLSALKLHERSE